MAGRTDRLALGGPPRVVAAAALLAMAMASAGASAAAPAAAREIEGLIAALGASGCSFERNGRWHDAARARAHLQRKYDWLRKRDLVPSAERFIERAATASSVSGKPYRVRCGDGPVRPSADWFSEALRRLRDSDSSRRPA